MAVAAASVLASTKRVVRLWIIEDGIDLATRKTLLVAWNRYPNLGGATFISQGELPIRPPAWWVGARWPLVACARFQLADVLPSEAKRCIYLDIDVLAGRDVGELFDLDMKGRPVAMALNDVMNDADRAYLARIGLDADRYCNSGVLLIDVEAWRREGAGRGLIEQGKSMPADLWFFDQDMLNAYFKGRTMILDKEWNCMDSGRSPDGIIQHLAGSPKPWQTSPTEVTAPGLVAWHRLRASTSFQPTAPAWSTSVRRAARFRLSQVERRVRRLLAGRT